MSGSTDILSQFPQTPGASGGDAFYVAFFVMVSMIVICGLVFFLGRIMRLRALEDWSKNEFLQVMVSAAIIGGLFILMNPSSGIIIKVFNTLKPEGPLGNDQYYSIPGVSTLSGLPSCATSGLPDNSVICFAFQYLSTLFMQIVNLMAGLFVLNTFLDVLSKLSIDIIVVEITPLAGLSSVVQVFNSILQTLMFLGIMVSVEMGLLQFINATALSIFLPIGAVLRTFFGTRRLGGALIALAVGMYLIFPLTIALNVVAIKQMYVVAFQDFIDFFNSAKELSPLGGSNSGVSMSSPESWTTYLEKYATNAIKLSQAVSSVPKIMITIVSSLVVQVVFLPVLSVILTVIAIKELAALFGSEINLGRFEV